mgnify:CR=1 FL=1
MNQEEPNERENEEATGQTDTSGDERHVDEVEPGDIGNEDAGNQGAESGEEARQEEDRREEDRGRSESEEMARMREAMLRLKAETDNREKRLEREMAKSRKFALESLMRDLLQVLDSMDQALASADAETEKTAYEGMELTRKQALQVLASHGLEVLDPVGERFDPSWHEAIATQPSEEHQADTVIQVLQKGYRLNERLIRPARVIVAKSE